MSSALHKVLLISALTSFYEEWKTARKLVSRQFFWTGHF